jgi:hypothetical protein
VERLGRSVQLGSAGFVCGILLSAGSVHAQGAAPASPETSNPAEIVAARELFRQGTEDADAGRFAEGLEKFKRVAAVKETAAVRFNIARCEEALGRTGGALADFEEAALEGREDPKGQDVAKLAGERADALRPRVARLTLVPPARAPDGMVVSLDGGKLSTATLGVGLPLDPGLHVVDATAPGKGPFHVELTLAPGEARSVTLAFPSPALPNGGNGIGEPMRAPFPKPAPADPSPAPSSQRTWGWVTIAGGGALAAASGVFLILHNNAVTNATSDIQSECTGAGSGTLHCPPLLQSQIMAQLANAQSQANTDEAAAITLVAASGVAILGGILLVVTAPKNRTPAVGSALSPSLGITAGAPGAPAGLSIHGAF